MAIKIYNIGASLIIFDDDIPATSKPQIFNSRSTILFYEGSDVITLDFQSFRGTKSLLGKKFLYSDLRDKDENSFGSVTEAVEYLAGFIGVDSQIVTVERNEPVLMSSENSSSLALNGTYQDLTGMSLDLPIGEWNVVCSGLITSTANSIADIALFENDSEVGGTNGYTFRRGGATDILASPTSNGSFHTSCKVEVITGTKNIKAKGRESSGSSGTFSTGRIWALKVK